MGIGKRQGTPRQELKGKKRELSLQRKEIRTF